MHRQVTSRFHAFSVRTPNPPLALGRQSTRLVWPSTFGRASLGVCHNPGPSVSAEPATRGKVEPFDLWTVFPNMVTATGKAPVIVPLAFELRTRGYLRLRARRALSPVSSLLPGKNAPRLLYRIRPTHEC